MDSYFTSVFLAEWALQKKFAIVGTMHHDRKGIPKEVKAIGNREEKSVLYVYHKEKNIMLASYINKKKSGKKNVIVLSTMHDSVKVTNDQRKKPQIHSMYDHTKGSVDVVDLLSTSHSTRIKSKRWPINAFAFILDTCRTNAKTILQITANHFQTLSLPMLSEKALFYQPFSKDMPIQMVCRLQWSGRCVEYLASRRQCIILLIYQPKAADASSVLKLSWFLLTIYVKETG